MAIQWLFCCFVPHNSTANNQNFPHTISISAMATPLPIYCSNCRIKQLDCNVSSHLKGACNACHVNGLECLSPPLLISCTDRSPLKLLQETKKNWSRIVCSYQTLHTVDLIQILARYPLTRTESALKITPAKNRCSVLSFFGHITHHT